MLHKLGDMVSNVHYPHLVQLRIEQIPGMLAPEGWRTGCLSSYPLARPGRPLP